MNVLLTGCAAIALYVAVTVRTSGHVNRNGALLPPLSLTGGLAGLALVAHAANLYPMAVTPAGLNLGVFTAASLIAWLVSLGTLVVACNRPVVSLAVVVLPFSALVIGASLLFSNQNLVPQSPGLALHIACSLVAYSLFVIAAVQAGYLAFAERQLRRHTPVLRFLPPLPVMESMMFQLVGVAFAHEIPVDAGDPQQLLLRVGAPRVAAGPRPNASSHSRRIERPDQDHMKPVPSSWALSP